MAAFERNGVEESRRLGSRVPVGGDNILYETSFRQSGGTREWRTGGVEASATFLVPCTSRFFVEFQEVVNINLQRIAELFRFPAIEPSFPSGPSTAGS